MAAIRTARVRLLQMLLVTFLAWSVVFAYGRAEENVNVSSEKNNEANKNEAQKDLFSLDIENLGSVQAAPAQPTSNGSPSTVLDAAAVRNSNASTTGELLERAASVTARRTSALNLDPQVRGYNSQQMNASANGISQLKTRVDIDSLFSQIDPGIVNSITLIDGPYSSLYGPGFVFINVDFLHTQRTEYGTEIHSLTNSTYETNGQNFYTRESVSIAGTDYGALLSYGIRSGSDYQSGGDIDFSVPASFKKWDTFLEVSKDVGIDRSIEFNYLRTEINGLELPGVAYDIRFSKNDQFNLRYVVRDGQNGPERAVLQTFLSDTAYDMNASSPTKQSTFFEQFITAPSTPSGDDVVDLFGFGRLNTVGVRSFMTLGEKDYQSCIVGADYRHYSLRYEEFNINRDGSIGWGGNIYGIPNCAQDDVGLFTNILCPMSDVFELNVGGRVDYVHSDLNANDTVITQIDDPTQLYYLPGAFESSQWLGMTYATGTWKTTEFTHVNAGVGFAMRAPTLAELYSDEPYVPVARFGNSFVDGNSQLEPEKNIQIDLGFEFRKDRWKYGARGFFANINDYILPAPYFIIGTPPGTDTYVLGRDFSSFPPGYREDITEGTPNADQSQAGYRYGNIDRATLTGGDIFFEVPLAEAWSLHTTMSYVQGTNHDPQQFVPDAVYPNGGTVVHLGGSTPLPGIYPLSGNIQLRWFEPEKERYSITFVTRLAAAQERVSTTLGEPPTAGFMVCSLRSHWQVSEHLKLTAGLENIFNENYTQHGSLAMVGPNGIPTFVPEPGRSGVFGIEYKY